MKAKNLIGLEITTRPWKKIALVSAILTLIITSFIPGPNVPGFYLFKTIYSVLYELNHFFAAT